MIQRIQSIFFLAAALCFGGEFMTSFASANVNSIALFADGHYNVMDHVSLQILTGLGILLCLVSIFLFRNRPLQIRIGYLATTLAIILPIVAVLIYMDQTSSSSDFEVNDQLGIYLPVGMIIFSILGVRAVKKDEELVESMDRLR